MSDSYSEAFQTLTRHFESNGLGFLADAESRSIQLFITSDYAVYNCRIQLTHDDELVQTRVHYPVVARDAKIRPFVAEALARANHGMAIGNFDIDMDTGGISFHLGQVIRDKELDDDVIGGIFSASLSTADRYFPAIMRVMFAGHTPADAVYLSELDVHAEALEVGEENPALAPPATKLSVKKPRPPRKDPRPKSSQELPGLFDERPDDRDDRPRKP